MSVLTGEVPGPVLCAGAGMFLLIFVLLGVALVLNRRGDGSSEGGER